jgi:hypothetical protein
MGNSTFRHYASLQLRDLIYKNHFEMTYRVGVNIKGMGINYELKYLRFIKVQ